VHDQDERFLLPARQGSSDPSPKPPIGGKIGILDGDLAIPFEQKQAAYSTVRLPDPEPITLIVHYSGRQ